MVRSRVMALLQRELGLKVRHPRVQEEQPRKEPVDVVRRERMRESLQTVADYAPTDSPPGILPRSGAVPCRGQRDPSQGDSDQTAHAHIDPGPSSAP
ncbi:hypothetical protein [Streptomyces sp. NPDC005283]|uniref:hypothetical protein n=1 Tax=Streptomyces sp. NPDC005283 TaxID=3156871 RepID=UPI003451CCDE